ncbi:MAG: potassium transporter Trk [Acidimicrobiia bacterium]
MADIAFIAVTLAFFALCVGYVRGLDRIVRGSEETSPETEDTTEGPTR